MRSPSIGRQDSNTRSLKSRRGDMTLKESTRERIGASAHRDSGVGEPSAGSRE
jgi:hypothetical protein